MKRTWVITKLCNVEGTIFGLLQDHDGTIFYSSSSGLWKVDTKTLQSDKVESGDLHYRQMAWNQDHTSFYLSDFSQHTVVRFDINTQKTTTVAGTGRSGHADGNLMSARFVCPWGMCADNNGGLYLTDFHHVRTINIKEGRVQTIAGSSSGMFDSGFKDGDALDAKFAIPCEVVCSDDNTLYVCDRSNYCIRKIKDGIVSTIAGTPGVPGQVEGSLSKCRFGYLHGLLKIEEGLLVADENGLRVVDFANENMYYPKLHIEKPRVMTRSQDGSILVGNMDNILKLEDSWKYERYLWIGKMKEDIRWCHFVLLPREILREIALYIIAGNKYHF